MPNCVTLTALHGLLKETDSQACAPFRLMAARSAASFTGSHVLQEGTGLIVCPRSCYEFWAFVEEAWEEGKTSRKVVPSFNTDGQALQLGLRRA